MISRRTVLSTAVLVVAAGAGAAAGLERPLKSSPKVAPPQPPAWLVGAIGREQALMSALSSTIAADPGLNARLRPALDDHSAHLAALRSLPGAPVPDGRSGQRASSESPAASADPVAPSSVAGLAAAETAAATAAAGASAAQSGSAAALLASISACEATHAAWLS
jgi:hypothetical protein